MAKSNPAPSLFATSSPRQRRVHTDLDTDRTAVYQLSIISTPSPKRPGASSPNFSTIRLYRKERGPQACEEFAT